MWMQNTSNSLRAIILYHLESKKSSPFSEKLQKSLRKSLRTLRRYALRGAEKEKMKSALLTATIRDQTLFVIVNYARRFGRRRSKNALFD